MTDRKLIVTPAEAAADRTPSKMLIVTPLDAAREAVQMLGQQESRRIVQESHPQAPPPKTGSMHATAKEPLPPGVHRTYHPTTTPGRCAGCGVELPRNGGIREWCGAPACRARRRAR